MTARGGEPDATPAPDPRSLASAQLLLDLVNETLDPGYAAAARRRAGLDPHAASRQQRWATPAVAVGCVLIGFLLVVAYVHTHRGAPQAATVHDRLVSRVREAQDRADSLARQAAGLDTRVGALRDAALPKSGALAAGLDRYLLAAGQTAVRGPGLVVTLSDPPAARSSAAAGRGGSVPIAATNTLTDRDVRSVVNELWSDGAEAIAVNGVRLTPTSTIRFAGEAVLVDFQPITSPYRVQAVGDSDALSVAFAQSAVASRYQTLTGVQGIGFGFSGSDELSLPAGAAATLRYAVLGRARR